LTVRAKPQTLPAVGGRSQRDLTTGSLGRLLAVLSWPGTAEALLFSMTGLSHAFWLGRLSSTVLSAAVMGTRLRIVLISPMMGLSAGGMALVARHIGAKEQDPADRAVMQTFLLVVAFVLPLAVLGLTMGGTFLRWMGASGQLLADAQGFVTIIFSGLVFMELLPTMNGVIKGAGHPEYTLRISAINIGMQLVLEPLLVFGVGPLPEMGVRGSALAAVIASTTGVLVQMVILLRGSAGVRLRWEHARPDPIMVRRILRIAAPTAAQRFSPNMAEVLLLRLVSSFGDEVLGAYSLVTQLVGFLRGVATGIGTAAATMVGQNLGAGRPERSERAAMLGAVSAMALSLALFGALSLFSWPILGTLEKSEAVLSLGVVITYYMVVSGAGQAWLTVMSGVLASAGDAVAAMSVNIAALWLLQLPLGWALSHPLGLGPAGIWLGLGVSAVLGAVAITWRFRTGRWKAGRV
jgi:putative MATE family efflux protein